MSRIITDSKKINELLFRGVDEVIHKNDLKEKLKSGKQLRIKLGIDPTSPNLHIGRSIPLLKLKDFQDLGHKVFFIIGDFTGVIGDTSDKESERPMLSQKVLEKNMKDYVKQVGKILDIKKCEIRYNSEWLGKLDYHEIGRQANIFSINEFISRENVKKRLDSGKRVSLREVLYPLMQGYDSVAIKSDVEIGGTDQKFNLLSGREVQRHYGQEPQNIITNPLIEGLDGRKMSSSWGNTINILDVPNEMYGKTMSLKDELIIKYFLLTTRVDIKIIKKIEKEIENGANPKDYKMKLAFEFVKMYHSEKDAQKASEYFVKTFSKKEIPEKLKKIKFSDKKINGIDALIKSNFVKSRGEARRLILQGGIKVNGKIISENDEFNIDEKGIILQKGKRHFIKIIKQK